MANGNTVQLFDYEIFTSSLKQIETSTKTLINTMNPYSFVMAERDGFFKDALLDSDVLLPDGADMVFASKILANKNINRTSGADLHHYLLTKLNKEGGRCFYLGPSESTLKKIKDRISEEYPAIKVSHYATSSTFHFNAIENADIIKLVNAFKPDVLFIDMNGPKPVKWAHIHKDQIDANIICTIGSVFDLYARAVNSPGKTWTAYYTPIFFFSIFKERTKQIISRTKLFSNAHSNKNILILGYNKVSKKIVEYLETNKVGINIIGFCEDVKNVKELTHYPVLCGIDGAINISLALNVHEIYSTIYPEKDSRIYNLMQQADHECIRFKIVPDFTQFINHPVNFGYLNDLPVLSVRKEPLEKYKNRLIKRVVDVLVSFSVMAFILTWLLPILGLLIFIESPGPIFFVQYRSGRNKKPFKCIKLRSMYMNKESEICQATRDDPRFTKIGKFIRRSGLDEFPQFINVLIGNMSLVGPRPHMLRHTEDFSKVSNHYTVRHFIKPGITGWAQINSYRGEITKPEQVQDRAEHDVWYLENWSIWLDIRILFLTVLNKLKGEKDAF
jgi:putative colanic acid biosysnthesis UDP-glucose lipid carrier transferase